VQAVTGAAANFGTCDVHFDGVWRCFWRKKAVNGLMRKKKIHKIFKKL